MNRLFYHFICLFSFQMKIRSISHFGCSTKKRNGENEKKKWPCGPLTFFARLVLLVFHGRLHHFFSFLVRTLIELKVLWLAMPLANNLKG